MKVTITLAYYANYGCKKFYDMASGYLCLLGGEGSLFMSYVDDNGWFDVMTFH